MISGLRKNVYVFSEPVDMRKSYGGLYSLVRGQDVLSGDLFPFVSKNRKRAKVLFWDGSSLNIWMKRLEKGCFVSVRQRSALTVSELKLFFEGSKVVARKLSPQDLTHNFYPQTS
jgi:transposase